MITVMGATGAVGGAIVRELLAAGEQVLALGRNPERLAALTAAGAETRAGDAADAEFLTGAFRGADAVHTLMPYDPTVPDYAADAERHGEAIAAAVRASGVRPVVALSSLGAHLASGTGFVTALHRQEERLRAISGIDLLLLRPGNFQDNFVRELAIAREHGAFVDAADPDRPVPMIATRDVAAAAAAALLARDWQGVRMRELLGPRDVTFTEAAAAFGLPYVRLGPDEMAGVLREAGFSAANALLQVELSVAMSDGTISPTQGRTAATTTPTSIADLAKELA